MTPETSPEPTPAAGDDQAPYEFEYGHGRMPFFMKVVWIAFLAYATVYTVTYRLDALGAELGG